MEQMPANSYPSLHYLAALSNTESALALFEKGAQLRQIIFAGLQRDRVDVVPAKHACKLVLAFVDEAAETCSRRAVGRVDFNLFAGLGVFQGDNA